MLSGCSHDTCCPESETRWPRGSHAAEHQALSLILPSRHAVHRHGAGPRPRQGETSRPKASDQSPEALASGPRGTPTPSLWPRCAHTLVVERPQLKGQLRPLPPGTKARDQLHVISHVVRHGSECRPWRPSVAGGNQRPKETLEGFVFPGPKQVARNHL